MISPEKKKTAQTDQKSTFVFGKLNYQLMLLSIAIVIIGFILMAGKTDIYSFTKITLAPIVVVAGFALGVVAILKNPKK
ncbi:DUF3098 domain-containing protein [Olivibacter ginsenosidimutans]|uniref:DUF3098 domain-containing protein n=1 Tax=Olivibacter ginsenosidimutans TaxID=1176537 RepID=A0ABP9BU29_9SPHI